MLIIGLILFGGSLFFIGHMEGFRRGFYEGHAAGWWDAEVARLEECSINIGRQLNAEIKRTEESLINDVGRHMSVAFDKKLVAEISPDDQICDPKKGI